jgi:hypothetical protein
MVSLLALYLLTEFTFGEYGIIGLVFGAIIVMLGKQMQFSNKMAADNDQRREQDLDKISAALIIIQEQGKGTTEMCKEIVQAAQGISENQKLLAKDMDTMKQLALSKESKQS